MARGEGNYCERVSGSPEQSYPVVLYFATEEDALQSASAIGLVMATGEVVPQPIPCAISLGLPNGA